MTQKYYLTQALISSQPQRHLGVSGSSTTSIFRTHTAPRRDKRSKMHLDVFERISPRISALARSPLSHPSTLCRDQILATSTSKNRTIRRQVGVIWWQRCDGGKRNFWRSTFCQKSVNIRQICRWN